MSHLLQIQRTAVTVSGGAQHDNVSLSYFRFNVLLSLFLVVSDTTMSRLLQIQRTAVTVSGGAQHDNVSLTSDSTYCCHCFWWCPTRQCLADFRFNVLLSLFLVVSNTTMSHLATSDSTYCCHCFWWCPTRQCLADFRFNVLLSLFLVVSNKTMSS